MFTSLLEVLLMKIIWYMPVTQGDILLMTGLEPDGVSNALDALEAKNLIWDDGGVYKALIDKVEVQHLVDTLYGGNVAAFVKQYSGMTLHHSGRELGHAS